ncbi:hypothetical protein BZA70DRAFT_116804 [Myxozyma melibiosi]|uniref:Ubiquitin carboxyl-terminal hydrolase n=1 Tax=Myxozyma melibiosi TaxID=54550 RepID=A0ABR1FAH6_9ASCO
MWPYLVHGQASASTSETDSPSLLALLSFAKSTHLSSILIILVTLFLGLLIAFAIMVSIVRSGFSGGFDLPDFTNILSSSLWHGGSGIGHDDGEDIDGYAESQRFKGVLGGLVNTGNTCFMNSVIQSLASLPCMNELTSLPAAEGLEVTEALAMLLSDLNTYMPRRHAHSPDVLLRALKSNRWTADTEQQDAHEFLLSLLDSIRTEQHKELARKHAATISISAAAKAIRQESKEPEAEKKEDEGSTDTPPVCLLPFDGLTCTRVMCTECGEMQSFRHQIFSSIELALPPLSIMSSGSSIFGAKSMDSATLDSMLDSYTAPETLSQVNCQRCSLVAAYAQIERLISNANTVISSSTEQEDQTPQETSTPDTAGKTKLSTAQELMPIMITRRDAIKEILSNSTILDSEFEKYKPPRLVASSKIKQVTLSRAPQVLALHVNRSEYDMRYGGARKRNTNVVFSERMQVRRLLTSFSGAKAEDGRYRDDDDERGPDHPEVWYRLMSTVVHFGSHSYGHYISYRRVAGNKWMRISDRDVREASLSEVLSNGMVVLLFYEREEPVEFESFDMQENNVSVPVVRSNKQELEALIKSETDALLFDSHENDTSDGLLATSSSSSSTSSDDPSSPTLAPSATTSSSLNPPATNPRARPLSASNPKLNLSDTHPQRAIFAN